MEGIAKRGVATRSGTMVLLGDHISEPEVAEYQIQALGQ